MQIKLPPDLVAFVTVNSGAGTHFDTPDEFIAAVLQEKRERLELAARDANSLNLGESARCPPVQGHPAPLSTTAIRRKSRQNAAD